MLRTFLYSLGLGVAAALAWGGDWPQFRGPAADGISPERGIAKDWNRRPPPLLWRLPLTDNGCAGPAVAGGRLYIVDHERKDPQKGTGKNDLVRALDAATGQEFWRYAYPDAEVNRYGFAAATPLVHAGKVYTWSRQGRANCLDAASGRLLWTRDLVADCQGIAPEWKFCASPVADGRRILFLPGGPRAAIVALDQDSGETLWQAGGGKPGYATPVLATIGGRRQYVCFLGDGLYGFDPERDAPGEQLWRLPWPTKYDKKGTTPLCIGERLLIATAEGNDGGLIDAAGATPQIVWKHNRFQDHFPTGIYYHGRVYGSSDPRYLVCLDPSTGSILWQREAGQFASVLGIDDTVIVLNGSNGELAMLDATLTPGPELGRCKGLGGRSWTAPIVADGRLYVRSDKELGCLDLK